MWKHEKLLIPSYLWKYQLHQLNLQAKRRTVWFSWACFQMARHHSAVYGLHRIYWGVFRLIQHYFKLHPSHSAWTTWQGLNMFFCITIGMIFIKEVLRLEQVLMQRLLYNAAILYSMTKKMHSAITYSVFNFIMFKVWSWFRGLNAIWAWHQNP